MSKNVVPCGGFKLDGTLKIDDGKLGLAEGAGGVQSDYNQNDETAKDYIKNRPFFEENVETNISGFSFKIKNQNYADDELPLGLGQTWKVELQAQAGNQEYILEVQEDGGNFYLGAHPSDLKQEPYFTIGTTSYNMFSSYANAIGFTGFVLTGISGVYKESVYHKLDPKFLPDNNIYIEFVDSTTDEINYSYDEIVNFINTKHSVYFKFNRTTDKSIFIYIPFVEIETSNSKRLKFSSFLYAGNSGYKLLFNRYSIYIYPDNTIQYTYIVEGVLNGKPTTSNANKFLRVNTNGIAEYSDLIIPSSTSGSTKYFKITVDDSGTISATEVTS